MRLPVPYSGALRWHLERAADPGTDPLVVRTLPLGLEVEVLRALRGEEPSAAEQARIAAILERHQREPLTVPGAEVRDYVIEVDDADAPPHRSRRSEPGYATREAALLRVRELAGIYRRSGRDVPVMRVVARLRAE